MAASYQRAQRGADHSVVSLISFNASPDADGVMVGNHNGAVVTAQDIDWFVAHLQTVVAASPVVWAGRGMTLLQLTALHLISALAPVTLTDLAQALGTRPPATSAMVERLTHAGLVCRTPDPHNRRRVQLTLTADAEPIVGDTDPDTARRLHAVLNGTSPQTRRHLIDLLITTVRRSAE
ncbi:MAG TPA: MarR family winged helix-turn-helix transcriptional regulator [Pseudonocardiaceae bacterium]|nr:MarR family winged helix-turn-helix transcriptional regulator [Pseudonocardiaceae bacterium]